MNKKFKILFIDIIDHRIKFQESYPHLGIGYIIAYLRRELNDLSILVSDDNQERVFASFRPDAVAISSVTQNYNRAKEIARNIKERRKDCPVIIGGAHISQLPESLDNNMDVGVLGEGEDTMTELIRHLISVGKPLGNLSSIKGLAFRRDGIMVKTPQRETIFPLDKIPHPEREMLPRSENQLLLTSRGCPYKCAFCASAHYWKSARYFSPDYVLEEIERILKHYPVLNLMIFDDLFAFNKSRLREISERVVKKGIHKQISFWCTARANHIDPETIQYLKNMNVKGVGMGLESGSDRVLKMLKSDSVSVEINLRAIKLCRENGLFVHGSFMLGSPSETKEDMLKTRDFIRTCGIDKGDLTVSTPLPGTEFWKYALQEKKVLVNMDWSKLSYRYTDDLPMGGNYLLLTNEVSRQEFETIFYDIADVLLEKRKDYERRWGLVQAKEISLKRVLSLKTLKKIVRDPLRAMRYLSNIIFARKNAGAITL